MNSLLTRTSLTKCLVWVWQRQLNFPCYPLRIINKPFWEFTSNSETLTYYPFPFQLTLTFRLEGNKLVHQFQIENTGRDTMYFALGGHPGFSFPYDSIQDRSRYQYTFSDSLKVDRIEIRESLVQPNPLPLLENENRLGLGDSRIPENGSGIFLQKVSSRRIGLGLENEPPFVEVDLGNFPNVNLWSPPGYPFACIEPMVSHHDLHDSPLAIEKKSHLMALPGGQSVEYHFSIIIEEKSSK